MNYNNRNYPHPVLGIGDSLVGTFSGYLNVSSNRNEIVLNPSFNLSNNELTNLISNDKAAFAIHIYCRATFFRENYFSSTIIPSEIKIPAVKLRGKTEVDFFVCCKSEDLEYFNKDFHSDYGNIKFFVEKSDILAYGGKGVFYANKAPEQLKSIGSLMRIKQSNIKNGPFSIDLDDDRILLLVSENDYLAFSKLKYNQECVQQIHSSLVFPALMNVLVKMETDPQGNYDGLQWYETLTDLKQKFNSDDPLYLAQKILEEPINRAFHSLLETFDVD